MASSRARCQLAPQSFRFLISRNQSYICDAPCYIMHPQRSNSNIINPRVQCNFDASTPCCLITLVGGLLLFFFLHTQRLL